MVNDLFEGQPTVLIVDDEPAGRESLEGVLFSQGYNLIFAENGQEAYQKALEFTPDMILLDVMMPNMDGYEVCRLMRSDPLLADIPILIVTALDDRSSRIKGIESGADDFISKPFDRIELRARVRTITRLNRFRRSLVDRAKFVWVVEHTREGYIILDADDRILYANLAAQTLLKFSFNETSADTFMGIVKKGYTCEPDGAWAHWRQPKLIEKPLFIIQPESGNIRPVWLQVELFELPVGWNNQVLVRLSDISEKLAFRQESWAFHSLIAHKLRTPSAGIIMAAEILNKQAQIGELKSAKELTEAIIAGAKRLDSEIQDIFLYLNSLLISNTGQFFNLAYLKKVVQGLGEEMAIDHLTLSMDESLGESSELRLSNRAMDIILREIFENARKFHPGLNPTLEVSAVSTGCGEVLLTVKDDGVRLLPDQLQQAWLPYYQADKDYTGEVEGMGLGLSTVATLVWGVGGKYRLSNREDSPGVVVELTIPLKAPQPTAVQMAQIRMESIAPGRTD